MDPLVAGICRLRPAATTDAAAIRRHWNRPEVRRYLFDDREVTASTVADLLVESSDGFARHGHGLWVVEPTGHGAPVLLGTGALWPSSQPDLAPLQVLYSLEPECWGRGLATAATGALLAYAFDTLGLPAVAAGVDVGNDRSAAVLTRVGMAPVADATTIGPLGPIRWWVITSETFRRR